MGRSLRGKPHQHSCWFRTPKGGISSLFIPEALLTQECVLVHIHLVLHPDLCHLGIPTTLGTSFVFEQTNLKKKKNSSSLFQLWMKHRICDAVFSLSVGFPIVSCWRFVALSLDRIKALRFEERFKRGRVRDRDGLAADFIGNKLRHMWRERGIRGGVF